MQPGRRAVARLSAVIGCWTCPAAPHWRPCLAQDWLTKSVACCAGSRGPRISGNPFSDDSDEEGLDAFQAWGSHHQAPGVAPQPDEVPHAMSPVSAELQLQTEQRQQDQHQHWAEQQQEQPDTAETAWAPMPASQQTEGWLSSTRLAPEVQRQPAARSSQETHTDRAAAAAGHVSGAASPPPSPFASSQAVVQAPDFPQLASQPRNIEQSLSGHVSRQEPVRQAGASGLGLESAALPTASSSAPLPPAAQPGQYQPEQEQPGTLVPPAVLAPEHATAPQGMMEPPNVAAVHHFPPPPPWQPRQAAKQVVEARTEPPYLARQALGQGSLQFQPQADLGGQQPQLQSRDAGARPELGSGFSPLRQAAPRLERESAANPGPLTQPQPAHPLPAADAGPNSALQAMLGSSAPDTPEEEAGSDVSAQDRMKFMQSLQSPDRGARGKTFAKGFGRMKARAKDMLQSGVQSVNPPAGQPSASQGPREGDQTDPNAGLSRGGKMARDVTMMFAGLKRPAND